jgi:hypothetical protein
LDQDLLAKDFPNFPCDIFDSFVIQKGVNSTYLKTSQFPFLTDFGFLFHCGLSKYFVWFQFCEFIELVLGRMLPVYLRGIGLLLLQGTVSYTCL